MEKVRSFSEVEARISRVADLLAATVSVAGAVDDYPIYHLAFGSGRPVMVTAGIHGEEPGSVEGALLFLEENVQWFKDRFAFDVLPCLNPFGYERHYRFNRRGKDPNRQFRNPEDPLNRIIRGVLAERTFALALDLHEDVDFDGFYIYEITQARPLFAAWIRKAMAREGPVCREAKDPPVAEGIVQRDWTPETDIKAILRQRSHWPLAFLLYDHTPRVLTLETPGRQPLAMRARMHGAGVTGALDLLE